VERWLQAKAKEHREQSWPEASKGKTSN